MDGKSEKGLIGMNSRKKIALFINVLLVSTVFTNMAGIHNLDVRADSGGPDLYGYVWVNSTAPAPIVTYNWVEINGTGINSGITGDDSGGSTPLGFDFMFYGNSYNTINMSTNGYVDFGNDHTDYSNDDIPNSNDPNNYIGPFWDDLAVGSGYNSGAIYYQQLGTAPNRQFIVEWCNITRLSGDGPLSFEVILNETGEIWFQYLKLGSADSGSATVGIENIDGTDGLPYSYNDPSAITPGLAVLLSYTPPPYRVQLSSDSQMDYGYPTGDVDYILTVWNQGLNDDTYDLSAVSTWPLIFRDIGDTTTITSIFVASGTSENFIARVTVDGMALPGDLDTADIDATSQGDPLVYDEVSVRTQVPYSAGWFDDLEGGWNGWTAEVLSPSIFGTTYWEIGNPSGSGPGTAYSGVNCAGTNIADGYYPGADIIIATPYVELGAAPMILYFYYWFQMDTGGEDGGFVDISVDGGPWNQIWPTQGYPWLSGYMGGYFTDGYSGTTPDWEYEEFDLSAYAGSVVQARFHFAASDWWGGQWGWYVDDVYIGLPPPYRFDLLPDSNATYGPAGSTVDFVLSINNTGTSDDTYDLTFVSTWPVIFRDIGDTMDITSIFVSSGSNTSFIARISIPGGASPGDFNTATINATSQADPSKWEEAFMTTGVPFSPPWTDDFETGTFGGTTGFNYTSTVSDNAGVGTHTSQSGLYSMYTRWDNVIVTSFPVDMSALINGEVRCWIRRGGAFSEDPDGGEDLVIEYKNDVGAWIQLETFLGSGTPGEILIRSYTLPADALHNNFQLRFRQTDGSGSDFDYWHIDDVYIGPPPPYRFHLWPDNSSSYGFPGGTTDHILFINNTGSSDDTYDLASVSTWPIVFRDIGDTMDITSIFVNSGANISFIARISIPGGASLGDIDTASINVSSQNDPGEWDIAGLRTQVPYAAGWFDDLEGGWDGWIAEVLSQGPGNPTYWEIGNPSGAGPGTAYSGVSCAGTNIVDDYYPGADITLVTPYVELGPGTMILYFYNWYQMDTNGDDGGFVDISVDGGPWNQIWPTLGYPWTSGYMGGYFTDGYSGTIPGWEYEEFDLSAYAGSVVQARFHFAASDWWGWQWGWYVDDVYIGPPPPYRFDLWPDSNATYGPAGSTVDFVLSINNTGSSDDTYDLSSVSTWPVTFRDIGDTMDITSIFVSSGANISFIARVSIPGGASPGDIDTASINVSSQNDPGEWDIAGLRTQVPYAAGWFDDLEGGWDGWIAEVLSQGPGNPTYWEIGNPSGAGPGTAYSGVSCAGTNIVDDYYPGADITLVTPYVELGAAPMLLNFYHWYQMDTDGEDGGFVDISVDGGPWSQIWPTLGYPWLSGYMGGYFTDGYSGFTSNWVYDEFDLSAYAGSVIQARFHFAASPWWGGQWGWYVDDVYIGPPPPYRFDLWPDSNGTYGLAGTTVDFVLSINNLGTNDDTYDLSSVSTWPVTFRDIGDTMDITTIFVSSGVNTSFIARVSIPGGASPGDFDTTTITVTSQGDPSRWKDAQTTTSVPFSAPWTDDFESGIFGGSTGFNWSTTVSNFAGVGTHTSQSGLYSMFTRGGVVTVTSFGVDMSPLSSGEVRCWIRRGDGAFSEDPDGGEDLVIEYKNDVGTWILLETFPGLGTPGEIFIRNYTLPADALHSTFQLRFRQTGGSGPGTDYWHIDDVYIGPPLAGDVTPPADISDLAVINPTENTLTLTWTAPGDDGMAGTATAYEVRYSLSPITDGPSWDSAMEFIQSWTPQPGGSSETHVITGLTQGTQYWFAIKTVDEIPNESGLSNSPSGTTLADVTSPATISDLAVSNPTSSSLTLTWTAPGDDGMTGTAASYIVKYSTLGPINDGNWDAADNYSQSWVPLAGGSPESHVVTGLTSGTQYWFAIKTVDEVPNESGASNSPSGTTLTDTLPPQISNVEADGEQILAITSGRTFTLTATVSDANTGNSVIGGANCTEEAQNWSSSMDMTAADGAFDQPTESVTMDVDASSWSNGIYELYVYGWDVVPNHNAASTAYATLIIDPSRPISSVDPISPYWVTTQPLVITATASDAISEVADVELLFRFSTDGSSWGSWTSFETDTGSPWEWNFDFPSGDGYYEFKTIATDLAGNTESDTGKDTECAIDTTMPASAVDAITPFWKTASPLTITATASDEVSGVVSTELFYRYSSNNSTWSAWTSLGLDTQTPWEWSFNFPDGEGYYEFYTKSIDGAANEETGTQPDARCGYDITAPTANAGSDQNVSQGAVTTFQGTGSGDNVELKNYTWTFTDGTPRTLYGPNPTYTFDTPGDYSITLTVTDGAGNQATDIVWVHVKAPVTTGSISGIVRDEDGNPVSGAKVTIPGTTFQAVTDSTGQYTIENVPEGTYSVNVNKDGFESQTISGVSVTAGDDTSVAPVSLSKSTEKPDDFLSNYWWLLVVIIVIIVLLVIMLLARSRKEKPKRFEDKEPLQPGAAEPPAREPPRAEAALQPPPEPEITPGPPARERPPPPPPLGK